MFKERKKEKKKRVPRVYHWFVVSLKLDLKVQKGKKEKKEKKNQFLTTLAFSSCNIKAVILF